MTRPLPAEQRQRLLEHCPDIDSLRALAMTGVLAMHAELLPFGWTGVWLFYVISGYVVTLSIVRNRVPNEPARAALRFLRHRSARILPPYFGYLLVGLALSFALSIRQPADAVASLFGFYHNVIMAFGNGEWDFWPVGHLWTISVEMQFYLIYGLVAHFASLSVTRKVLWGCVFLAPVGRLIVSLATGGGNPAATAYLIYSAPGLHFDSFAFGCLFALARVDTPLDRLLWPIVRTGFGAIVLYCFVYALLNALVQDRTGLDVVRDVVSGILYGEGREVFLYSALGLASLALIALTVARHPLVRPVTGLPVLQWIGRISYGCYIYHALCLRIVAFLILGDAHGVPSASAPYRIAVFLAALAMTVAFAQFSWRWVERPAIALARRSRAISPVLAAAAGRQ